MANEKYVILYLKIKISNIALGHTTRQPHYTNNNKPGKQAIEKKDLSTSSAMMKAITKSGTSYNGPNIIFIKSITFTINTKSHNTFELWSKYDGVGKRQL